MPPAPNPNPKTPSGDYVAQATYWTMVSAILQGAEALRAAGGYGQTSSIYGPAAPYENLSSLKRRNSRNTALGVQKGSPYLPQFPNETDADYNLRRQNAPLTNIYADISRNLASKPFSKTLELEEDAADDLKKLEENIDGQGNNQHVFARTFFKDAVDKGIAWILVDYNNVPTPLTLAAERAAGLRPYWVHIPAERLIAVYSAFVNGSEIRTHARIYEPRMERDGYGEKLCEYVREFDRAPLVDQISGEIVDYAPATWTLWKLVEGVDAQGKATDETTWIEVDGGQISIGIIPLIPYITGKRDGATWKVEPPLKDIAYLQIEEFQQESGLKNVREMTGYPMLAGNGVMPPTDEKGARVIVPVGPKAVLFAPPTDNSTGRSGSWSWIEAGGSSFAFLQKELESIRTEMRDLGMQPLTVSNQTVVTTQNLSIKAHSAVQAWALGLKDALEQAWVVTCMWLGQGADQAPAVKVHTDFGVEMDPGSELQELQAARVAKDLSQRTFWDELKRRGVLSDDFDADNEEELLATEQQGQDLQPEKLIDPITGLPLLTPRVPGIPNPPPKPTVN